MVKGGGTVAKGIVAVRFIASLSSEATRAANALVALHIPVQTQNRRKPLSEADL